MLNRFATIAAICVLVLVAPPPLTSAAPSPFPPIMPGADAGPPPDNGDAGPPPPDGAVLSADPGILRTPDGYQLTVSARNETQLPVPPLTDALSSREYLVGGTFNGSVRGPAGGGKRTSGTLEAGYQVGCGIELKRLELVGNVGATPSFGTAGLASIAVPVNGTVEIELSPGTVNLVTVDKKMFEGTDPRVSITGVHIKVDGCVGQSFLRSYATLTSSTENSDDVVSYLGVTMAV